VAAAGAADVTVEVEGRAVRLTHLDRVLWPDVGLTKGWMVGAYTELAPALLPHLRDHPVTMWRYPEGVHREGWWQNECRGAPPWLRRYRYTGKDGRRHNHCVVDDLSSLLWMVNQGTVEIHPFLHVVDEPARPRSLVFDMDPGPPATLRDGCRVAIMLRDILDAQGVMSFPKTSGNKGVHAFVPLNTPVTFEETKAYARTVAGFLAREHPDLVVDRQAQNLRHGKVLVDWLQNDRFRSTVAPYSLRATRRPQVSMPVDWQEIADVADGSADPSSLVFGVDRARERLERDGDLFAPVLTFDQRLVG
jgi:bifunctional non-homologous end joining protein LigD